MGRWSSDRISELCKINKGKQVNRITLFDSGEYYVLNGGMEPSGYLNKWNKEADTISISEGGNSCGFVKYNTERFWSGGHCYTLEELKNYISKKYYYHYLKFNEENIMSLRVGSGLPNIQKKELSKFNIRYPENIKEQEKISEILSEVDIIIDKTRKIIDKYKYVKEGLLQDLLTNGIDEKGVMRSPKTHNYKDTPLGMIPIEWDYKTLEKLSDKIGDGLHGTPNYDFFGDYYFINGNNLINNKIEVNAKTKKVSSLEYTKYKKVLNSNTILISINGTIGNIALYTDEKVVLGKSVAYININNSNSVTFLYILINSRMVQKYFKDELTGTTIKNLSLETIRNTNVVIPSTKEQIKIAELILAADEKIQIEENYLKKIFNIKKGLMQDLLNQKVSVDSLL